MACITRAPFAGVVKPPVGMFGSAVNVMVVGSVEVSPALLVVVIGRVVPPAEVVQAMVLAAGLPDTVPGVYVQPVGADSAPKVEDAMPDSASVPVEVSVIVAGAAGR